MAESRKIYLVFSAALCLTLIGGSVYGYWTHRWGPTTDLQAAARQVHSLPEEIGEWRQIAQSEISPEIISMLECAGYVSRTYVNQRTGETVKLAIIVGPTGPTAVHTPEICYSSRDYEIIESPQKMLLRTKASPSSFWRMTFRSRSPGSSRLRVYYAWSTGAEWIASRSPRVEFGVSRMLYKIQLASLLDAQQGEQTADACKSFLESLGRSAWTLGQPQSSSL